MHYSGLGLVLGLRTKILQAEQCGMAKTKNKHRQTKNKDVKKRERLCTLGENINGYSHYRKQYGGFSKNEKYNYRMIQHPHYCIFI